MRARLLAVAGLVTPVEVVADVGTGDALLACHLVRTGRARRVIATDARPGPLEQARATVTRAGLADSVELRRGRGLLALRPGEAEVIVVAGMGARAVVAALEAAPAVAAGARRLVLQPNGDPGQLRSWLLGRGFRIADEDMVRERGRYYQVVAAEPAGAGREPDRPPPELLAAGLEVGPRLWERRHPLLAAYLDHRLAALGRALEGAPSPERAARRLAALRALRRRLP